MSEEGKILPFAQREGSITQMHRESLRMGRRMLRLAESVLADPDVDSATLDLLLYTVDRGIFAIQHLQVWAQEEQQEQAAHRWAACLSGRGGAS
jgi:hypothetical protein